MSHRLKTVLNLSSFPVKQSQPRGVGGGRWEGGTFRTFKCPSLKRLKTDSKHVESEQEKPRRWRAWSLPHRLSYCGNKRTSIFFLFVFFFLPSWRQRWCSHRLREDKQSRLCHNTHPQQTGTKQKNHSVTPSQRDLGTEQKRQQKKKSEATATQRRR